MALIAGATSDGGAAASIVELLTTTADPSSNALTIPAFFELGAVVAGAISGALEACNKRLDIIGVCVLGLITALGGGLIRDMILPTDQIYMLDNPVTVLLTTAGCNYFMGIPHGDDVMLNYQTTGFHETAALREMFGLTAIKPFQRWLEQMGFVEDNKLTALAGDASILLA